MATLKLKNLKKTYANGHQAIHGVDLDVREGELIVMVGPSGCGKSTLLRMIAGLEAITEGTLEIDQRRVNDLEPADRDIAMVFQNYALYPHMKVYDNMAYGLKNRGVDKAEIDRLVRQTAAILELDALLERKPGQLSGGQRQRVAMGRAIVRNPKVFLFDEPLSNLDAKLRVQMRIEIRRLQRKLGITSVYVTHDQVEAMTLADRLVVMNGGVAEQIGTPMDIYNRPQTPFVAGFIGSPAMNFIQAQLHEGALTLGDQTITLANPPDFNGALIVGLRPEHMHRKPDYAHQLMLHIDLLEPLGADTLVYGRIGGSGDELVVRLNREFRNLDNQAILPLYFDCDELHLFCAKSQQRIN